MPVRVCNNIDTNMAISRIRSKYWLGTQNNPTLTPEEFEAKLKHMGMEYRFQKEMGECTGTPHYQISVITPSQCGLRLMQDLCSKTHS